MGIISYISWIGKHSDYLGVSSGMQEDERGEGETEMAAEALQVQMFSGFTVTYRGKSVIGGVKSRESQFIYLMQLLLHRRRTGISRELLEEVLFEDRDVGDVRHALRSVIYNAKKKLRASGLPDVNYIEQKDGLYYWTEQIPVAEDAEEFERLYREAEKEEDPDSGTERWLEACYCYTGEFLPLHSGILWVMQEAKRYRGMFCECVERAAGLLKERGNFLQMEELGAYAAKINPLSNYEIISMEALVKQGRYEDARKLYDNTADLYFREQGLRPSEQMMTLFRKLGERMEHRHGALDDIQAKLTETENCAPGGYLCSYPVFQGIYRMVGRMMERGGQSVYLMLCTVVDGKGNPLEDVVILEEFTGRLGDAILNSVRRSDAVTRYGRGEYLVLLVNTTREDCDKIQKRINYRFIIGRQRTGVQYYVNSVICTPDGVGMPGR